MLVRVLVLVLIVFVVSALLPWLWRSGTCVGWQAETTMPALGLRQPLLIRRRTKWLVIQETVLRCEPRCEQHQGVAMVAQREL